MKRIFSLTLSLMYLSCLLQAQPCKEIVGYYPNWQWYDRAKLVNPLTINYNKYTVLNYCFYSPQANGNILSTDQWADDNILDGPMNWQTNSPDSTKSLVYKAHQNNVKVLASIGGWTLSGNFSAIASTVNTRRNFAHQCVELCKRYNYDGIDIDWEYPVFADKQNFTALMQSVRDSLNALGVQKNKTYLLSAAVSAAPANMNNIEWAIVKNIFDFINVMTYDFFGAWENNTNHNAPLYAPSQGDATFNCSSAMLTLINTHGVHASKLNMGIAFYGRSAKTVNAPALFGAIASHAVDNITFNTDDGSPTYFNLLLSKNLFSEQYDAQAQVPYLTGNGTLKTFVSYDDSASIALKAQFIVNQNLRGAIVWELTGDFIETSPGSGIVASTPLANALNANLCSVNLAPTITINTPVANSNFVAPASINITATASDADGTIKNVKFYNGTTLLFTDLVAPYSYTWTNVPIGTFTIKAKATDNKNATKTVSRIVKVTAVAVNQLPSVSITSPANNATFIAPASIAITANASDVDGTIQKVQFYYGTTLLKTDTVAPYAFTWNNVAAGTYVLKAKATDNQGGVKTSALITVVVNVGGSGCPYPQYVAGSNIATGDTIKNNSVKYLCTVGGWCSSASALYYEPGVGLAWQDAWLQIGACSAPRLGTNVFNHFQIANPVSDFLMVYGMDLNSSDLNFEINDLAGRRLMTDKLLFNSDAQLLKVDVSKLKPGIYILVMKNASGAHSYRFVKM